MTLAVEIELLAGRYVATYFNARTRAEWPPHPARLFSAAVAAWADDEHPDVAEREVLEWLERQPAPLIACDLDDDVARRSVVTHFVRVNDATAAPSVDRAYAKLRDAHETVDALREEPEQVGNSRAFARATEQLEKATVRAVEDSRKAVARKLPATAIEVLPEERDLQARTFPSVTPRDPRVVFTWPDTDPTLDQRTILDGLLARIGRLGHSSSLVSCRLVDEEMRTPTLKPDDGGDVVLRVPGHGQFELLEDEFARHKGVDPRVLPAVMQPYIRVSEINPEVPESVFSRRWIVFAVDSDGADKNGLPVSIRASLPLARAFRAALIEHAGDDVPELLSGRVRTATGKPGRPSGRPHAAIVPLPFVGHRFADSLVRGMAVILPKRALAEERVALMRALEGWERGSQRRVVVGSRDVQLLGSDGPETLATLRPGTWCRKSACWATVTPLALDRFRGNLRARDPQQRDAADHVARHSIARACKNIGLPLPVEVIVRFDATVSAVPPVRAFPSFKTPNGGPRRTLVHAHLRFENPIAGPVLLGAGRFVGQGLCMPVQEPTPDA